MKGFVCTNDHKGFYYYTADGTIGVQFVSLAKGDGKLSPELGAGDSVIVFETEEDARTFLGMRSIPGVTGKVRPIAEGETFRRVIRATWNTIDFDYIG